MHTNKLQRMRQSTALVLAALVLLLTGCDETVKYPPTANSDLQIRFVSEVEPDSAQPDDFYGDVLINQTDLEYIYIAEEELRESPNRFGLAFKLKPEAAQRFAEITRTHVGKRLAIVSRGEVLNTAEIREEINTYVMVSAQLDRKAAEAQLAMIVNDHGL